jgi:hypothetical protein
LDEQWCFSEVFEGNWYPVMKHTLKEKREAELGVHQITVIKGTEDVV